MDKADFKGLLVLNKLRSISFNNSFIHNLNSKLAKEEKICEILFDSILKFNKHPLYYKKIGKYIHAINLTSSKSKIFVKGQYVDVKLAYKGHLYPGSDLVQQYFPLLIIEYPDQTNITDEKPNQMFKLEPYKDQTIALIENAELNGEIQIITFSEKLEDVIINSPIFDSLINENIIIVKNYDLLDYMKLGGFNSTNRLNLPKGSISFDE